MDPAGRDAPGTSPDAEEFVRFCYRRRRVGWPELYDEMCAVATRGSYRGMGRAELAELGIGFSLFETRQLAEVVHRVVADEHARRARTIEQLDVVRVEAIRAVDAAELVAITPAARTAAIATDTGSPDPAEAVVAPARLVTVASGA